MEIEVRDADGFFHRLLFDDGEVFGAENLGCAIKGTGEQKSIFARRLVEAIRSKPIGGTLDGYCWRDVG